MKYFVLPNGGSVTTHLDVSEQRRLSRQLASTKQFLETVLDNVPACVAAKNIEDGRYIFANSAYERFWGFSRDHVVGKNARELFGPNSADSIEATDRAALDCARRPVPQRIRGRPRRRPTHGCLDPDRGPQREQQA